MPYPTTSTLWVQSNIYEWEAHWLVAMTAIDMTRGDGVLPSLQEQRHYLETGVRSGWIALNYRPDHDTLRQQMEMYRTKFNVEDWNRLLDEADEMIASGGRTDLRSRTNAAHNRDSLPTLHHNEQKQPNWSGEQASWMVTLFGVLSIIGLVVFLWRRKKRLPLTTTFAAVFQQNRKDRLV